MTSWPEWWIAIAVLLVCIVLITLWVLWAIYETLNVVSCLEEQILHHTPAKGLEVYANRTGHIVERHALGYSWYWYEGKG
jgi:hypothetical protein